MKKIMIFTIIILALALAFFACEGDPDPGTVEYTIKISNNRTIPVDYSESTLNPNQKSTATTNLQEVFSKNDTNPNDAIKGRFETMVNRSGFMIIVKGTGNCTREGDNMVLGNSLAMGSESTIGAAISQALNNDLKFAD